MSSITITGQVVNSNGLPKFVPDNTLAFQLAFAKFVSKQVRVTVTDAKNKRSEPQNSYYWGVIIQSIVQHLNSENKEVFSETEIHELLKYQFCPEKEREVSNLFSGEVQILKMKSTTLLSTTEAEEYYEQCRAWAATNLGLVIPLPNE